MPPVRMRACAALVLLAAVACMLATARPARAVSTTVVLSQIYGGGGNTGATYTNDYVEIFNRSLTLIDTTGMSVQYTSATGTGNSGLRPT